MAVAGEYVPRHEGRAQSPSLSVSGPALCEEVEADQLVVARGGEGEGGGRGPGGRDRAAAAAGFLSISRTFFIRSVEFLTETEGT